MFKHAYYILFLESQEVGGEKKNGATQKGVQQDNDDHDDDQWEDCDDNQPQQHGTKARPCNENCRFAKKCIIVIIILDYNIVYDFTSVQMIQKLAVQQKLVHSSKSHFLAMLFGFEHYRYLRKKDKNILGKSKNIN